MYYALARSPLRLPGSADILQITTSKILEEGFKVRPPFEISLKR
jgi:hypothetical protein